VPPPPPCHQVALAAKALGEDPKRGVATVRFWGKVLGSHGDYYVYETTLANPPEGEPEANLREWLDLGAAGVACVCAGGPHMRHCWCQCRER
jgi:hypothetical protein